MKLAWLASGNGMLLRELNIAFPVSIVVCDRQCASNDWAKKKGIPSIVLNTRGEKLSDEINDVFKSNGIDFSFCTFRSILSGKLISDYKDRIINYHPAPLPEFAGIDPIEKSFSSGLGGFVYHMIEEGVDTGKRLIDIRFNIFQESLKEYGEFLFSISSSFGRHLVRHIGGNQ